MFIVESTQKSNVFFEEDLQGREDSLQMAIIKPLKFAKKATLFFLHSVVYTSV